MCTSIFMTASLKPTHYPAWPSSFKNDLLRLTSPPLGRQRREPRHRVAQTLRRYQPASACSCTCWSLSLHFGTPCIPPDDRLFSPRIIEMILTDYRIGERKTGLSENPREKTPYRVLCNGVKRECVKTTPVLALRLF